MKERRTAATDGAMLLTDDGVEPLTASAVIRLARAENVMAGQYKGYRPLTAEAQVAAAPEVIFYDGDGTVELGRIPTVEGSQPGKYYIHWKQLNNVPDYSKNNETVILTWKKKGDVSDTRYVLSNNAFYQAAATTENPNPAPVLRNGLVYLEGNLELVPLKTMTMTGKKESENEKN